MATSMVQFRPATCSSLVNMRWYMPISTPVKLRFTDKSSEPSKQNGASKYPRRAAFEEISKLRFLLLLQAHCWTAVHIWLTSNRMNQPLLQAMTPNNRRHDLKGTNP